ncbi:MAG: MBL fold metallo-hydrolase [Eubacterium sp.]|nr:MBL fold metallo-hydrolase [Eubacterium sp.]
MICVKTAVFGQLENNCYLLTDDASGKSALVDCTDASDKMIDFIGNANLEYILLTHGHFDHIGGVKEIKEKYGAKVVISNEDAGMLSSSKLSLAAFCGGVQNNTEPDILVQDGDIITLGEAAVTVLATPGHTKGGVCYMAEDVIFTGDTLFFCSCGRTDFPGGSFDEIKQSLKRIAAFDKNYRLYPGHDRATTLDFEKQNNPYMR